MLIMHTWRNLGIKALIGRSDNPEISESSTWGTSSQICIERHIRAFKCTNSICRLKFIIRISQPVSQKGEVPHLKMKMLEITKQWYGTVQIYALLFISLQEEYFEN